MKSKWIQRLLIGGILGLLLSVITAEYFSQSLRAQYQSWTIWRSLGVSDPNQVTSILTKICWAFFFVSSWLMLWKLDCFWAKAGPAKMKTQDEPLPEEEEEEEEEEEKESEQVDGDHKDRETQEHESTEEKTDDSFASVKNESDADKEELHFAETLGVEKPFEEEKVKAVYRKLIAQYHPDRVSALGPEIREVAEQKAKEINEAYEYFRKKFEADD
ncbi:DnaJ domain-containing protein [Verrucomicrobia bacterium]|nr:DnaJ domain-containing protein [Verrucomicrobiota bacterium]